MSSRSGADQRQTSDWCLECSRYCLPSTLLVLSWCSLCLWLDATCPEDSFAPQCCCCSMNALLPALDEGQNVNDHFELQFNPNTNIWSLYSHKTTTRLNCWGSRNNKLNMVWWMVRYQRGTRRCVEWCALVCVTTQLLVALHYYDVHNEITSWALAKRLELARVSSHEVACTTRNMDQRFEHNRVFNFDQPHKST